MATKLRLWRGESDGQQTEETRTLRFPAEAASAMPAPARARHGSGSAVAGRVRPSIRRGPTPGGDADLVRHIEETLDRVQARFDDLKQQIASAPVPPRLSFPRLDDNPPRPAA